ncbi:MAG: class I SAM-dependent methyltransferase [Leptospiraceae bacterium]|nr:class I SAM-dependent methyltransferase [Leptospiraceae bacterium]
MNSNSIQTRIYELFPTQANQLELYFDFEKLESYFQFLKDYNEIGGFFSKSDSENILDRHILESVIHIYKILLAHSVSHETRLVDIGTGPGLPGYIFYTLKNPPYITLVDSQMRRLGILEKFHTEKYQDQKVTFIYARVEDIKEKFDLVIMRSTIKYPWSAEMICRLLKQNSCFIPFLGRRNYDLKFEQMFLENLGLKIEKDFDIPELEFLGNRHMKVLKKIAESKKGFPRKWEAISKEIKRTSWEK